MTAPYITLKFAFEAIPSELRFEVGKNGCELIERAEGGGFWIKIGRVTRYCADWRVNEYVREDPPPPDYKCKLCSKPFDSEHALKIHTGMRHGETRP